jgi:hypothetical protein
MAKDYQYYAWNGKTTKTIRKTPKQLRLIDDKGYATVLKPTAGFNNLNGVLHTITFGDGSTRQWFLKGFKGYGHTRLHGLNADEFAQAMKEELGRGGGWVQDYGFIKHPDDKVFTRDRIVYAHKWAVAWDGGRVYHDVSYDGVCFGERAGIHPPPYLPVHRTYVVCETWVKWGGLEILLDDGLKRWITYTIADTRVDHVAPRKGKTLRLTDFRSSPVYNPFDDPFEPELKAVRDKRNAMSEELAAVVFHPARLERMMDAYGDDWLERV